MMYGMKLSVLFKRLTAVLLTALCVIIANPVQAERIKDLANIQGVRSNQLLGYGLVVGLDGSGDKVGSSPFTQQSLRSMLTQLGIVVPPNVALNPKNVAAVTVHADLPAFAKPGQAIDVTVSSIGEWRTRSAPRNAFSARDRFCSRRSSSRSFNSSEIDSTASSTTWRGVT